MTTPQARTLALPHGGALALHVWEAQGAAVATVVIGGAMGVPQSYYASYASWLAEQGYRVWTFDYRGHGASHPHTEHGGLRGYQANLFDWVQDYEAVVELAQQEQPGLPLYLLGHSFGAQVPGLFEHPERVNGLFSMAAGSGYWRENAPQLRRYVLVFWHVVVPVFTRACGYFPGRRLGMVGNLPSGVIHQWRRWCMHPRYSGVEGAEVLARYASARYPVLAWSFSDDEMMTLRGTRSLLSLYAGAPQRLQVVHPVEVPQRRIGHFGFFRDAMRTTLWPRSLAALRGLPSIGYRATTHKPDESTTEPAASPT